MINKENLQNRLDETRKAISRRMSNLAKEMDILDQIESELTNDNLDDRLIAAMIKSIVLGRHDLDNAQTMLKQADDDSWCSSMNYVNDCDRN